MNLQEFVEVMRTTLDYSRTIGVVVASGNKTSSEAIFYLAALRSIECEPFDMGLWQQEAVAFIRERLAEVVNNLTPLEIEDIFCTLEDLGYKGS